MALPTKRCVVVQGNTKIVMQFTPQGSLFLEVCLILLMLMVSLSLMVTHNYTSGHILLENMINQE